MEVSVSVLMEMYFYNNLTHDGAHFTFIVESQT